MVRDSQIQAQLWLSNQSDDQAETIIDEGLLAFNREQAGYVDAQPLAVLMRMRGEEVMCGGLIGRTSLGLLFIDLVFLPNWARGQGLGSRILKMAEQEARKRGCTTSVLYTITFQAPDFYARHGYRELGRIEVDPPGHTRICMTKRLAPN
jgi:GNAT superfamily N-acetyltransferase